MDLSSNLIDAGVSPTDIISFARVMPDEFGIRLSPENVYRPARDQGSARIANSSDSPIPIPTGSHTTFTIL